MADIVSLPEPALPDGWAPSAVFAEEWVRPVLWVRPLHEGESPVRAVLQVGRDADGDYAIVGTTGVAWTTLREAMQAAERAYCNCVVGRALSGGGR